jgi:hypothetical protein
MISLKEAPTSATGWAHNGLLGQALTCAVYGSRNAKMA